MSATLLYLFDDSRARAWAPFSLTRPVGELLYGCLTIRQRTERVLGLPCTGHLTGPALEGFDEPDAAPAVAPAAVPADTLRVVLSSRAILDFQTAPLSSVTPASADAESPQPIRLAVAGETVGWILPPGTALPPEEALLDPSSAATDPAEASLAMEGEVLARPWSLMAGNARRIVRDVEHLHPDDHAPPGVVRVGGGVLSLGPDAVIEPGVVVDTRHGPVRLENGVRVEGPARLIGPLWVGAGSIIFGGSVGTSSIGPVCKVRGEVADSVLVGYANKAHDGFLGHAVVGQWVNLGALTTNSDLKNNYGTVRTWTPEGVLDTGLTKVGCLLGDHVKTGIGTLLNTGTVIGVGSNVFGGLMPPSVVLPFSWGAGSDLGVYRLDKFLETAEVAMGRRGRALTPGARRILEGAWHGAHPHPAA